jgi:hypothetical protein
MFWIWRCVHAKEGYHWLMQCTVLYSIDRAKSSTALHCTVPTLGSILMRIWGYVLHCIICTASECWTWCLTTYIAEKLSWLTTLIANQYNIWLNLYLHYLWLGQFSTVQYWLFWNISKISVSCERKFVHTVHREGVSKDTYCMYDLVTKQKKSSSNG